MLPAKAPNAPYGLQIIESCLSCPLLKDRVFCDLPEAAVRELDQISSSATYPKGAVLFVEGQQPRGVFVLCNGRVKLMANSAGGKSLIVRVADAGEIVGLPGTISGHAYELTAETLEPVQANFIPRERFLSFLRSHGEVCLRVAEILTKIYHDTHQELRYLALSGSAAGKFARFLLDCSMKANRANGGHGTERFTLTMTHEEISERIGASRETVTRLFAEFKRKKLIEVRGSSLAIINRPSLERVLEKETL